MAAMAKVNVGGASARRSRLISAILVNGVLALICIVWLVPLVGLLVSSFRERGDIVLPRDLRADAELAAV